ncbi:hypothetical protein D3C80_774710 [compost metagenome]
MGILLTFMFLWNMLGALILIPALSYFLLRGTSHNRSATLHEPLVHVSETDNSKSPGMRNAQTTHE